MKYSLRFLKLWDVLPPVQCNPGRSEGDPNILYNGRGMTPLKDTGLGENDPLGATEALELFSMARKAGEDLSPGFTTCYTAWMGSLLFLSVCLLL